jgi:hypothetical protein
MLNSVPYAADERHPVSERLVKPGLDQPPEIIVIPSFDSPADLGPGFLLPPLAPAPVALAPAPAKPVPAPAPVVAPAPAQAPTEPALEKTVPAPGINRARVAVGMRWGMAFGIVAVTGVALYGALWGLWWLGVSAVHAAIRIAPVVGLVVLAGLLAMWLLGGRGASAGTPRGFRAGAYGPHGQSRALSRIGAVVRGLARATGVSTKVTVIGLSGLTRTVTRVATGAPVVGDPSTAEMGTPSVAGAPGSGVARAADGSPLRGSAGNATVAGQLSELWVAERARSAESRVQRHAGSRVYSGGYGTGGPAAGLYGGYAPGVDPAQEATLGARMLTRMFGDPDPGAAMATRGGVEVGRSRVANRDPSVDWSFSEWLFDPRQAHNQEVGEKLAAADIPTEWMTDRLTSRWCQRLRTSASQEVRGSWAAGNSMRLVNRPCRFCAVGFLYDESDPNGWYNIGTYGGPRWAHHDQKKMYDRYGMEFLMATSDMFEEGASLAQCADFVESWHPSV